MVIGQLTSHETNRRRVSNNLLGDSFSVSQQPPSWDPCSHYSMCQCQNRRTLTWVQQPSPPVLAMADGIFSRHINTLTSIRSPRAGALPRFDMNNDMTDMTATLNAMTHYWWLHVKMERKNMTSIITLWHCVTQTELKDVVCDSNATHWHSSEEFLFVTTGHIGS